MKRPFMVEARSISDAWFQLIYNIFDNDDCVYSYKIERGSYVGQMRYQYALVGVGISKPWEDIIPEIPPDCGFGPPTDQNYIDDYFANYLMRAELQPNEQYTYGSRICLSIDDIIEILKKTPYQNQTVVEVAQPSDINLPDPPCLRLLDFKVIDGVLHVTVYFRSWDLWSGFPSNLGGIELLKQYVAAMTGLDNGGLYAVSSGLHLYEMYKQVAEIRLRR